MNPSIRIAEDLQRGIKDKMMRYFGTAILSLCIAACLKSPPIGPAKSVRAMTGDSDLKAVRAWLKDNLDDSKWQEVRWWPGRDMVELKEQELANAESSYLVAYRINSREVFARSREHKANLDRIKNELRKKPPIRLSRLKYRAKNKIGANELFDQLFLIKDGKARPEGNPPYTSDPAGEEYFAD